MTTNLGSTELLALADRLKQEAAIHAQEARTANATIAEIYQLCSDATGESGNWHGAEPVRAKLSALNTRIAELERELAALKSAQEAGGGVTDEIVTKAQRAYEKCGGDLFTKEPPIGFTRMRELQMRAALEAVAPMMQGAKWEPIESAPHEKLVLLGWWRDGKWITDFRCATSGWRRNGVSTFSQHGQATHWMPLPSPPSKEETK